MPSPLRLSIVSLSSVLLLCPALVAQTPAPPAGPPRFAAGAEVVALDLVVRDKKGKLVTDLQPAEIEVLEDDVPQKVISFRTVEAAVPSGASGAPAPSAAAAASAPASSPRHVVMVFGRLSSDGRRLAQGAGDEFAKKYVTAGTLVTVVRIDGGLMPVVDRVSDPVAVKEAVRKATAAIGGSGGRGPTTVGSDTGYAAQNMGRFEGGAGSRDLSQSESIAFVSALVKVVDAVKADPGRKTVLLFSEGFMVPAGYEIVFADLQSRANRANVSFYGIDVRGLQLSSNLSSSGAALASAAAISEQQRNSGSGSPVTREQATQDDTTQSSMRSDVVDTLAHLSSSTGGFLVTQTNDFGRPLARIAEDIRGYYEASYTPATPPVPGQFRRIEVRVARKDVRLQSRSGYYTTPPPPPIAAPATSFAAFAAGELPAEIDVHGRFFRFGRPKGASKFDCLLKLEASLAKTEFKADAQGRFSGKLILAGRVVSPSGDVVETFAQDVSLGGTQQQVDAARQQVLPLARRLQLPAGNYTVELIVRDAVSDHKTALRIPVTVPAPESDLLMSSLVVVAGVETADPQSDRTDPLLLGDKRIVPNLGVPVMPAPGAMLPIYYNVFVKPGSHDAATATIEVTLEGKPVARGTVPLAKPDAGGRITGLSPIPLQKLTAGAYVVKVSVSNGKASAEETTTVSIGS